MRLNFSPYHFQTFIVLLSAEVSGLELELMYWVEFLEILRGHSCSDRAH
jgi:hypothetical protein